MLRTRCGRRLGLHRAAIVQYLRPEIMGLVLGSLAAAIATREFKPRGGSAPIVRFVLGMIAAMGALVFLGCRGARYSASPAATETPSSALPVWATGDLVRDALFQKRLFPWPQQQPERRLRGTLPRHRRLPAPSLPHFPANPGSAAKRPPVLLREGPRLTARPLHASLGCLHIGIFAQRSRFCTMGAFRDLFLFRYTHLFLGPVSSAVMLGGRTDFFLWRPLFVDYSYNFTARNYKNGNFGNLTSCRTPSR